MPWNKERKGTSGQGPLAFLLAISPKDIQKPRARLKEFSLVNLLLCGLRPWPVPTAFCVCVRACKRERESSHFHEKGVQRMDRGHIFLLWDSCRCDSESTRATSSIKLRIAANLHPVFLDTMWSRHSWQRSSWVEKLDLVPLRHIWICWIHFVVQDPKYL